MIKSKHAYQLAQAHPIPQYHSKHAVGTAIWMAYWANQPMAATVSSS